MKLSSKIAAGFVAILVATSGVSHAWAAPNGNGKSDTAGKPTSTPSQAAATPKITPTPGNLKTYTAPGASTETGKPAELGKPTEPGKPTETGKPAETGKLVKVEKPSQDSVDKSPKANYIVRFNEAAVLGNEVSALKKSNIAVSRTFSHVFKGAVASMNSNQVAALKKRSTVASVEADSVVEIVASEAGATWGIDRIDQATLPLTTTYDYTNTGAGTRAFVIDTGVRATHIDFAGRMLNGYSAIADGNGTNDCNGHGTHVAGTIGGATYGVAKSVSIIPVRVLDCAGSGTTSGVIAGIDWVAANYVAGTPAVANLSLGGGISTALDSAINNLINRGVTVVVAAGNSAADACGTSPARVPNAITVAASDSRDAFASFSNHGSCVDIIAPGVGITSTWITSDSATAALSGTSMASPHVAGVVALLLSTGYRLPTDVATKIVSAATNGAVTGTPTATANRLVFSSPSGWAPEAAPETPTATAPAAATGVSAKAGSRSATVSWVRGADGGSPLTGQTVKVWSGLNLVGTVAVAPSATSVTIKGLRQNATYQFSVVETNAVGSSPDSAKSASVKVLK
jgi:subtilisin family serine protease